MDKKGIGKGATVGIAVIVVIAGFLAYWYGLREAGIKPKIKNVSHNWGNVNQSTTEIESTATVHNPNPIGIDVKSLDYTISADGLQMATGGAKNIHLSGGEDSDVDVTTTIQNAKIPDFWVDHLNRNESTTFKIKGSAKIDLEATTYTYSFEQTQDVSTDILAGLNTEEDETVTYLKGPIENRSVTLKSLSSSLGEITAKNTEINHEAVIHNDEGYPIVITELRAVTKMNDVKMAETSTYTSHKIPGNSDETIPFETQITNENIADWWPTHINQGESTQVKTTVYAIIDYSDIPGLSGTAEKKIRTLESSFETNLLG